MGCAQALSQKTGSSERQSTYGLQETLLKDLIGGEFDISRSQQVVADVISGKVAMSHGEIAEEIYTYGGISGNIADTVSTF